MAAINDTDSFIKMEPTSCFLQIEVGSIVKGKVALRAYLVEKETGRARYVFEQTECRPGETLNIRDIEVKAI